MRVINGSFEESSFKVTGISLLLDCDTAVRVYFTCDESVMAESSTKFYLGYSQITPKQFKDDTYYIEVTGLGPTLLADTQRITFVEQGREDISIEYSAFSYVYSALKSDDSSQGLIDLVIAVYDYSKSFS